uniref:(northern house mosquito) hypothetical protein n=1 Tax=Culex pipiens TaxID=7175 RepID=A0A8D8NKY3_CULPI
MTPNKFLTACVDDKTDLACKRARADCTTTNTHTQLNATHTHTLPLSLSPALSRRLLLALSLLGPRKFLDFSRSVEKCVQNSLQSGTHFHARLSQTNTRTAVVRVENAS